MTPLSEAQKQLVQDHLPIVKAIADARARSMTKEVTEDDLFSAGALGLMDAAQKFDASRGVKFSTYCVRRIHGAIADYLRDLDWVPRKIRERTNDANRTDEQFFKAHGRYPNASEVHYECGTSKRDHRVVRPISIDAVIEDERQEISLHAAVSNGSDFLSDIDQEELRQIINKELLTRCERLVFNLLYYEGMTMNAVGRAVGLSYSRVSQINSDIIAFLKSRLVLQ